MKNKYIEKIEKLQLRDNHPLLESGDTIIVYTWVKEGSKRRVQAFKGFVLGLKNRGLNSSFIVRKGVCGEGIERTFQMHSPIIKNIKVEKKGSVRQSKLYYMRKLKGKASKIKERI